MATWRSLGVLVAALAVAQAAPAETYTLSEAPQVGECYQLRLNMVLTGELRVTKDGKTVPIPLKANSTHEFAERVLIVGKNGLPVRNARHYDAAKASITVGTDKSERVLRPECSLMVAQRPKDQLLSFCPSGPLTRQELELTSEHLDPLTITGLLPGKAVAVGDTWKVANPVAQALCAFEGLISQDLTCKLEAVNGDSARIGITGGASGIDLGAMVKLTVQSSCKYDLKAKRIVALEWKQKDERELGPASPATSIEATTTLTRALLDEEPKALSDSALVDVPEEIEPAAVYTQLVYRDSQGRFNLIHAREWQLVSQTEGHVILRLMERGDFVAQVTMTPWAKAEGSKHMKPEEFKEIADDTPGWEAQEVREDGEVKSENGNWVYRVSASGEMDGLKVLQNFFLVAGPEGDQLVLSFTMRQALADKLGTRDLALVNGIEFPKSAAK